MDLDLLRAAIRPGFSRNGLPTAMIAVETSHSGGCVPGLGYLQQVADSARAAQPVHMDGARVQLCAVALGVPVAAICACADIRVAGRNRPRPGRSGRAR